MVGKKIFKIGKQIIEDEDDSIQVISTEIVKEASVESKVPWHFNPKIFKPGVYNRGHITSRLFKLDISTPDISPHTFQTWHFNPGHSTPYFSTLNSSYPHFSIMNLGMDATKNLGRARPPKHYPAQSIFRKTAVLSVFNKMAPLLGLKLLGLKLGVEKYGVEISYSYFNPRTLYTHTF